MGMSDWFWKEYKNYKEEDKEEIEMAKVKVKFTYGDGKKVTRQGPSQVFNLRAPVEFTLAPGQKKALNLGVTCSYPVHVFETKGLKSRNVKLVDGIWACQDADQELVLNIENASNEPQYFEEGEVLARCAALDNSNLVIEE